MSGQKQASAVTVRLPRDLADRVDAVADGVPRERWVRRAVLLHLEAAEAGHPGNAERFGEAAEGRHSKGWGMVKDPLESSERATVSKPGPLVGGAEAKPHPAIRAEAAPSRRTQTKVADVLKDAAPTSAMMERQRKLNERKG